MLLLPHGLPSHDTGNRVCAALDPQQFEQSFINWVQPLVGVLPPQVIALDGKTLRGSREAFHATPLVHLISVWASANRLVLTQVAVAATSNAITALPPVLAPLDITGCLVTNEAMGCQRALAHQMVAQGGQEVLAVKDNQPDLAEDIADCFRAAQAVAYDAVQHQVDEDLTKGHGRGELRHQTVSSDPAHLSWVQAEHHWPGLAALGRVATERQGAMAQWGERRAMTC